MASSNQEKMDEQDHLQKDRCSFDGFPWFFASSLPLFSLCLSHLLESMPQGLPVPYTTCRVVLPRK